ncbi:hypothetical protein ACKXGF_07500 [Alkalibacillus sp. S2W]|uniref:hypothetical protein n=1 Tax=Alkalibacillus sp. S2W TaxID=3386553 RepID=UPI00398D4A0E
MILYRDTAILNRTDGSYDYKGNLSIVDTKTIKCNYQPSSKIVEKAIDGTQIQLLNSKIKLETNQEITLDDYIKLNADDEEEYQVIEVKTINPLNKRLPITYIVWCK